jgi:hypothetical protein
LSATGNSLSAHGDPTRWHKYNSPISGLAGHVICCTSHLFSVHVAPLNY